MTDFLRVKQWEEVFYLKEAYRRGSVYWTKFPVNRPSLAYRGMMADERGRTAFCVFVGIIRLIARGKTMGVLKVAGAPMTAAHISAETGIPEGACRRSIDYLKSPAVGWLEPETNPIPAGIPPVSSPHPAGQKPASLLCSSGISPVLSGGGPGEPDPTVDNGTMYRLVLRHYPRQEAMRGAYPAASDAAWRLAHAKHGGDIHAALAFLGDRVQAYAAAKATADKKYIPMARKWFEDGRYNDDPAAWSEQSEPTAAEKLAEFDRKEAARKAKKLEENQ